MSGNPKSFVMNRVFTLILILSSSSCSTLRNDMFNSTEPEQGVDDPLPLVAIPVPKALQLEHPEDFSISRLEELFGKKSTPLWTKETLGKCVRPITELQSKVHSYAELENGFRELVRTDPVLFHWCFYGTLLDLEKALSEESFILEKQSMVLRAFKVLAPISKAFLNETSDSRYYRYSIRRYQELTERVFFRKVEVLSEVTEKLVNLHHWPAPDRQPSSAEVKSGDTEISVLKKNGVEPPEMLETPRSDDPWSELDRYPAEEK